MVRNRNDLAAEVTSPPSDELKSEAGARAGGLRQGFAALRHRNYRIFFFCQLFSLTGTWMQGLAQSWLVLDLTDSAVQLGLINVCQFGPMLLFGLFGGVIADRFPKRRLLRITQALAAALASTLAGLVATGAVELWHIYAIALTLGVVNSVDMPTRQAFVAELVGKADLMNAVALNSALFNASRVIGPALAGLLLATVGATLCFVANAVSYLPVLVGLAIMQGVPVATKSVAGRASGLRAGLAYVRGTPMVLLPIALVGFVATFGMNFNVWVPLLAKNDLRIGAGGFGMLMAAMGVGSLTGALTLAFRAKRPQQRTMLGMAVGFGTLEIAMAWAGAVPLPAAIATLTLVAIGFALSTTMATANTFVQTTVPDELRGRVMSIYMTVFAGSTPIGALFAGVTARWWGTPASLAIGGGVVVLAGLGVGASWNRVVRNGQQSAVARLESPPLGVPSGQARSGP